MGLYESDVVELMRKEPFTVTVRCGSSTFCLVTIDAREACIEAEHYIRNVSSPGAVVFEISGAAPETTRIIRYYLSNLRVEILTDQILQRTDLTGRSASV
jgi:hypothetical protein